MIDYRTRLEARGLFPEFDQARRSKNRDALRAVLKKAKFNALEIDALVWSNGEIPEPVSEEEKRRLFVDGIAGRIWISMMTGILVGGIFVYHSMGFDQGDYADRAKSDYRTVREAVCRPFAWGFGIGALVGLVAAEKFLISFLDQHWKKDP